MEERMKKGELGKLKEYKNGEIPRFWSEFFNEWISRIVWKVIQKGMWQEKLTGVEILIWEMERRDNGRRSRIIGANLNFQERKKKKKEKKEDIIKGVI